MIPKIIHCCWFGGKDKPELTKKCIESWRNNCPDYQIIEWNESNFDMNCCEYVRAAYLEQKWAFITDYVRLYVLYYYGGVYMDTDVEVLRPIDSFLNNVAFSGFQEETAIPTGIMACEKGYKCFKDLLDEYHVRSFYLPNGQINSIANTQYITRYYLDKGLVLNNMYQKVDDFSLYPIDYFCAKSWATGIVNVTENTYTIHHFAGSWIDDESQKKRKARYYCEQHLGIFAKVAYFLYKVGYRIVHPCKIIKKILLLFSKTQ
jgi:hypothetical protein